MKHSVYTRPNKPKKIVVTPRRDQTPTITPTTTPTIPVVDRYTECHVTPMEVAHRMVSYLGKTGDYLTLEPSAGTGNLLRALFAAGYSRHQLIAIERHSGLCSAIKKQFTDNQAIHPLCECFLEHAKKVQGKIEYPRIVMNPPFKKVRQHMKAALHLLGTAGHDKAVLVALVPMTYDHDDAETLEKLPRDTFSTTTVSTKIVRFTQ